jgi:hypothetical protein
VLISRGIGWAIHPVALKERIASYWGRKTALIFEILLNGVAMFNWTIAMAAYAFLLSGVTTTLGW